MVLSYSLHTCSSDSTDVSMIIPALILLHLGHAVNKNVFLVNLYGYEEKKLHTIPAARTHTPLHISDAGFLYLSKNPCTLHTNIHTAVTGDLWWRRLSKKEKGMRVVLLQEKWSVFCFSLWTLLAGYGFRAGTKPHRCFCHYQTGHTHNRITHSLLALCVCKRETAQHSVSFNQCRPICGAYHATDTSACSFKLQMLFISLSENILS